MPMETQSELYHFTLFFQSVKMKVKFPCKLSLEHAGNILTNQVSAKQQNKFLINEEVVIKDESEKKYVQIVVNLITEKGSKYIAGIIKLFHNELLRSEGQRIVVALAKCLDSQAFCQLKVAKVVTQKITKRNPLFAGSKVGRDNQGHQHSFSPAQQANFKSATQLGNGFGTRSQAQFNTNNPLKSGRQWQQKRQTCALTYYQKNKPSPPKTRRKIGETSKIKFTSNIKIKQDQQNTNRQKLIEAQVYKQNYQKLKEKYRKQSQNYKTQLGKRIALQNNENNYKLEIVRLRLKCQELDKSYNDKNLRLRDLQSQLAILQQKDIDINYYKEETSNLKNNISMLEDTIITLNTENEKLKELTKERQHQYENKMHQLEAEYQKLKGMYEGKQSEYERDMRVMKQQLIQLEYELHSKTESLQKQKNYIYDFEKSSQAKLFEFDTLLQNERNNFKLKYEQLKSRYEKLELQNKQLQQQKKDLQAQKQNHRSYVMKTEYEYKLQLQQINNIKNQLEQLQGVKDKYQKLFLECKSIKEEKQFSAKNFDKLIKNKDMSFEEIITENKKQIEFVKKINSDLSEKNKSLIEKNIEYDGLVQNLKNTVEKNRRALQAVTKDFTELKQKQKSLKKILAQREEQIDEFKQKLEKANTKQSGFVETKRTQIEKMNQIINKLKIDLEAEGIRVGKLSEQNSQMAHEISRLKMMLQFTEQKIDKNTVSAQQKYKSYESIIQEHEGVISMLQQNINGLKMKENQLFNKFSQIQNQYNFLKQQYEKQNRQNKILTQKLIAQQNLNKQKNAECVGILSKYEASQKRNQDLQNQVHQVKTDLSLIKSEKQKTLKLLQISNAQNQKCRQTIIKFSADIFDKESKIDTKTKDFSKIQEQLEKAVYKNQMLSKQYAKFKQSFAELMSLSFKQYESLKQQTNALMNNLGQITQQQRSTTFSSSLANDWDNKYGFNTNTDRKSKFSNELTSKSFNDIANFTTQILSNFSNYSKENQSTITRLIEKNKILAKDLETLKSDLSQQISQNQQLKYESERQREQIEEELRTITHQKGSESMKFGSLVDELKQQIYQKQQMLQEAHSQLDELQFTLSSNKMDYDASINEIDKKNYQLKQFIEQIEEKNQFQHNVITSLQQKCYELDKQIIDMKNTLIAQKQISYKKQTQIIEIKKDLKQVEQLFEAEKHKVNKLLENLSNLQVELTTQKENNQKLEKTLTQEQEKKKQLKAFSAHIIKQKQTIIKQQLEHHQKLSELQNKIIESQHHKQLLLEQIQATKAQVSQLKLEIKRQSDIIKQNEKDLNIQKSHIIDAEKSIKDRQKSIQDLQSKVKQILKTADAKQSELKKTISQLNEQMSYMTNHKQKITEDMNQKIIMLEKQVKSYDGIINEQKTQMQDLQQHLYAYKQKSRVLEQNLVTREHEVNELRYKSEHLESLQADLQQDTKDKQENMYELSATIYELESKISTLLRQKQVQIEEINNEWNLKYEDLYQQLQQRFELIQKQKQYLKQQIAQKQSQINKRNEQKKNFEFEVQNAKKIFEDKIKKLQEERLGLLTNKNLEIQKQSEEIKQMFESTKKKEAENRKLSHELQIARNQIMKLDTRILELDQKIKSINKLYQQQLQQMKKKQVTYKNFKQEVINQQWNSQRQIRKALQAFTKSLLTFNDENRQKSELMGLIKQLQGGVIGAIRMFDEKSGNIAL